MRPILTISISASGENFNGKDPSPPRILPKMVSPREFQVKTLQAESAVLEIFHNPHLLREAPPFAIANIKRALSKFSITSMKWEDEE